MSVLSKGKDLVCNQEIRELSVDLLSDCIALLAGDITAAARIIYSVAKGALALREQLFWNKFQYFLNNLEVSEDYLGEFCRVMAEDGSKTETMNRLLDTIDKVDTTDKARYLANASRCVACGMIDKPTYFRICHALKNNLQEDLVFLQKTIISSAEHEYSDTVQGLWSGGLMYQSVIDSNGNDRYAFTPFAYTLDMYALSYGDTVRYPMCGHLPKHTPDRINVRTVTRLG